MKAKKQTKKLLQEGGLNQEGGTVDPVSDNEVPMGSTQEEVRDDIPAQLSEGEFVFPADVVRFIGLDTLMKLRQTAKAGLAKMDNMDRDWETQTHLHLTVQVYHLVLLLV